MSGVYFFRPDIQVQEHADEDYLKWGTVWEAPPYSFVQYITVNIDSDRYILVDAEHSCCACTFSSEPHGPIFTKEQLVQRLKGFKRVGVYWQLAKEDAEWAFSQGKKASNA